jgi:tRNA A37 methylthiotransferase MiaB
MRGRPSSEVVKRRVGELRELGEKKRIAFHASMSGRTLQAIVEGPARGGGVNALTSNYIKVLLDGTGLKRGVLADIVVGDVSPDGTVRGRKA